MAGGRHSAPSGRCGRAPAGRSLPGGPPPLGLHCLGRRDTPRDPLSVQDRERLGKQLKLRAEKEEKEKLKEEAKRAKEEARKKREEEKELKEKERREKREKDEKEKAEKQRRKEERRKERQEALECVGPCRGAGAGGGGGAHPPQPLRAPACPHRASAFPRRPGCTHTGAARPRLKVLSPRAKLEEKRKKEEEKRLREEEKVGHCPRTSAWGSQVASGTRTESDAPEAFTGLESGQQRSALTCKRPGSRFGAAISYFFVFIFSSAAAH